MNPTMIDEMGWAMGQVYGSVQDRILVNLAKYFPYLKPGEKVPGAFEYQARMLAKIGQVNRETAQIIVKSLGGADEALRQLLETAIRDSLKDVDPVLKRAAEQGLLNGQGFVPPAIDPGMMNAFKAYYNQSKDKLNLVNTVMLESTEWAYTGVVSDITNQIQRTQEILNANTGEVISGVTSYNQAVRNATRQMVTNGLTGFIDHGGHRWSPEAYAAMDIKTTMMNAGRAAVMERNEQYGNDLYQVSSHAGARPLCYPWQGKIISSSGRSGTTTDLYGNEIVIHSEDEIESFRYGGGLFGVNCGHYPMVFIPNFSTIRDVPQDKQTNDRVYAESQEQRALERKIRQEKLELDTLKAQGADKALIDAQKQKVKAADAEINDFCERTGRHRLREREYTPVKADFHGVQGIPTPPVAPVVPETPTTPVPVTPTAVVPQERSLHDSLVDAYEYHRTQNGLTSVPYDPDSKLKFIVSDLEGLGKETQRVVTETIDSLVRKYDTPLTQVYVVDKKDFYFNKTAFAGVSHTHSTDTATMKINPLKCRNNEKLIQRIKELRSMGYCAYVPDEYLERYVYTHEFGHSILKIVSEHTEDIKKNYVGADFTKIKEASNRVSAIFNEYREKVGTLETAKRTAERKVIMEASEDAAREAKGLIEQLKGVKISEYSLTDVDEFFAESFVHTEYGGTNPYALRVREIINEYFLR